MANSVTAVLFSLLLPSCLPGIKLDEAAAVNVTQARTTGGTLTLATWNILAVSKCEMSANGFVGMEKEAFEYHNKGCLKATETGAKSICVSDWIQDVIPTYFERYTIDAMFLQEVDQPMLAGLNLLASKSKQKNKNEFKYKFMPVTGSGEAEQKAKDLRDIRKAGGRYDFAYVVWDATRVNGIKCRHVGEDIPAVKEVKEGEKVVTKAVKKVDMSRVGLCTITKDTKKFEVLGMHGDGDVGFTPAQANLILTKSKVAPGAIGAILGDLNVGDIAAVKLAIEPLNAKFVVPDDGEKTVYRVAHEYRKLVQSLQNSKILDHTNELAKHEVTCEKKTVPEEVTWCSDVKVAHQKDAKGGKTLQFFQMIYKSDKPLFAKILDVTYDWRGFPADIGLDPKTLEAVDLEKARTAMIPEILREDWVAYDTTIFAGAKVSVPFHHELKRISGYTGGKTGRVDVKYPIMEMASDHLPVIMKLSINPQAASSRASARIRSKKPFKPFNRFVRRALRAFVRSGSAKS